jgi:alkanesulfonate monooxygenase SsuD/methylene tetrahydromethanopterin reductase-like flavin-dependent oxidoreductase (luciferase family)
MKPFQSPHPPILVGSHGPRGLRHVAEYGDEWFPVLTDDLDFEQDLRELAWLCRKASREPARVTVVIG